MFLSDELDGMVTMMLVMETSPVFFICLAAVINTFLFLVGGSGALRDVEIVIPRYIRRGEDVKLTCNYNQETDQIYAVNWYKGQEFYRFVPKEAPPQKAFHRPGFQVDVRRSNDHEVFLKNVSLDMSGMYKCSVTAEQTFKTLSSLQEMTVVVIGEDMPTVQLERIEYHPGDTVMAECHSPFSTPTANISWFLNETKVGPEHDIKTELRKSYTDPMTQSVISKISFGLPLPDKLSATPSASTIKCRVTVFTFYDQNSTTKTIVPIPTQYAGTETLLRAGTSSSSKTRALFGVGPDSAVGLTLLLTFLPSAITAAFFAFSSFATEIGENFNWLLCCIMPSLLSPLHYLRPFSHNHHHPHRLCLSSSVPMPSW